jgi:hypothetical protein
MRCSAGKSGFANARALGLGSGADAGDADEMAGVVGAMRPR